ncbi:MAG: agmatinase family protein [Methylococcales bacterium]
MSDQEANEISDISLRLFDMEIDYNDAGVIVIPVPWEVTVSYHTGTANAPEAILKASEQIDLYDLDIPCSELLGIHMLPINSRWRNTSRELRSKALEHIRVLDSSSNLAESCYLEAINLGCHQLKEAVKSETRKVLADGKIPAVLGGDHSVSLGLIEALCEQHEDFGILAIDAHADLRKAYQGFTYSHASIMYNVIQNPQVSQLTMVGVRDLCAEEMSRITESGERIRVFFDAAIKEQVHFNRYKTWNTCCDEIIETLPRKVYISFDIDGLNPVFCPSTGTPVPGGLDYCEAMYLLKKLVVSGKTVVGFDLNEVASDISNPDNDWDANVGARVLYKMANLSSWSQKRKSDLDVTS